MLLLNVRGCTARTWSLSIQPGESTVTHPALNSDQRSFLAELKLAEGDDPGIPVYLRDGEKFHFLREYKMATSANRHFEKNAPAGLYRGGAVILVKYQGGTLVVPDDRYGWFKPFAGIAQHDEGHDLTLTGFRELNEEAFVYDLKKKKRFGPAGWSASTRSCSLGFTVDAVDIDHFEALKNVGTAVNEDNRAYEAVLQWDISSIGEPFSVSLEESWWSGHHSGVSVYVMNDEDGSIRGVFSGQQGFVALPKLGIHPTLKAELHLA